MKPLRKIVPQKKDNCIYADIRGSKNLKESKEYFEPDSHERLAETHATDALHKSLSNHYKFGNHEERSLGEYAGGSKYINGHLWAEHTGNHIFSHVENELQNPAIKKTIEGHVKNINHSLLKRATPHELHVYSGTPHDPREKMDSNKIVHHPAYLSTSLVSHIPFTFATPQIKGKNEDNNDIEHYHMLKITVPKGHPGAYISTQNQNVGIKREREFLLPRGSNLKYHGTDTVTKKNHWSEKHYNTHHLTVMPHKELPGEHGDDENMNEEIKLEPEDFLEKKKMRSEEQDQAHELHKKLSNHYSNYSKDNLNSIKDYTFKSTPVSDSLWENHKNKNHPVSEKVKGMDSVVNAHRTPEAMTVYSKGRNDPRKIMNKQGIIHHPAFISSSISRGVAKDLKWNHETIDGVNNHHIMQINVPKGHAGAYVDNHSSLKSQKEFILPRGLNMKYKGYKSQKMGNDVYHYHELELL